MSFSLTPMTDMVNSINIPMGMAGSFFKNPISDQLTEISEVQGCMSSFADLLTPPPNTGGESGEGTGETTPPLIPTDMLKNLKEMFTGGEDDEGNPMPSAISSIASSMTSTISDKLSNLTSELSIMNAAKQRADMIQQVDQIVSGKEPDQETTLDNNFPGKKKCISIDFGAAFAPLTKGAAMIGDAVKDMTRSIKDMFAEIAWPEIDWKGLRDAAASGAASAVKALKDAFDSIKTSEFVTKIKGFISGGISSITSALSSIGKEIGSALSGAFNSLKSSFDGFKNNIKDMIDGAKNALNDAMNTLKNFNLLNFLGVTDPCIRSIMENIVNPEAVNHKALEIAKNPDAVNVPINTGVQVAKSAQPLEDTGSPKPKITPPSSEEYSAMELVPLRKKVNDAYEEIEEAQKKGAAEVAEIERWKDEIGYNQLKVEVGYTKEERDGTTQDIELKAKWIVTRDEFNAKAAAYNNGALKEIQAARERHRLMYTEYQRRLIWGKRPYTKLKERGVEIPEDEQTVLLDSGI